MKNLKILFTLIVIAYIYIYTLAPTITTGDSGELITSAYTLGITHPPGYPLYVVIGKIFSCLPIGSISFRINLMSIFFALCSLLIFYKICCLFFFSDTIACIATLAAGISYTLWSQSIISEVYTLHIFFVLFLLWILLRNFSLRIFSLFFGLGLCNHHTLILFIPLFVYKLISEKRYKDILIYTNFFIGLSLYLFMPIRSLQGSVMNWGQTDSLNNFIKHISRSQFGNLVKDPFDFKIFFSQTFFYFEVLFKQISILFLPFFINGIYNLILKEKKTSISIIYLFFVFSFGIILGLNFNMVPYILSEVEIFLLPSYIIFIFISFYSLDNLLNDFQTVKIEKGFYFKIMGTIFIAGYLFSVLIINLKALSKRYDYFLYDYGLNLLKSINKSVILFTQSNHQTFSLAYLTIAENRFQNTIILDREENFFPKFFTYLRNSLGLKTRVKIEKYLIEKSPEKLFFGYIPPHEYILYGILYALKEQKKNVWDLYTLRNNPLQISLLKQDSEIIHIPDFLKKLIILERETKWKYDLLTRDLIAMISFANIEKLINDKKIDMAVNELDKISSFTYDIPSQQYIIGEKYQQLKKNDKAKYAYNQVLTFIPDDYEAHNNLGIIYTQEKDYFSAFFHFKKAINIDPDLALPYYNIGVIYQDKNDLLNALYYINKASQLDSTRSEIFYNLGLIYTGLGNLPKAEKNYLLAIDKDPEYILARNNLSLLYLQINKIEDAKSQLETALQYDTLNPMTYYNIANLYESIDKRIALQKWYMYLNKASKYSQEKNWIIEAQKHIEKLKERLKTED